MSAASTSARGPGGAGGTDLARCSPPRVAASGWIECGRFLIGGGTWTRFACRLTRHPLPLAGCRSRRRSPGGGGVSKTRDRKAAPKFLGKTMRRHGHPHVSVTDKLRSYGTALRDLGPPDDRVENSHQPFRRRARAMLRFRRMRSLQKFVAVQSSIHTHLHGARALTSRENCKADRAAALARWRQLCAA